MEKYINFRVKVRKKLCVNCQHHFLEGSKGGLLNFHGINRPPEQKGWARHINDSEKKKRGDHFRRRSCKD